MSNLALKSEKFIIPKENIEITTILDISFTNNEVIFIITRNYRKYFYKALFSDLKNSNNDFQYFPSTEIFVKGVKKMIENKSFHLEINDDKLLLKLYNQLFDKPLIIEIPFEKDNINSFSKEKYNEFENKLDELQKKNELLKEEVESLKSEIKNLKMNVLYIKDTNKEEIINQMFITFQESELTKNECYLLLNWLNNAKLKFTKIYCTKRDGDSASKFHEKCDGKSPTITIIKTSKGIRFGGYTNIPWIKSNSWKFFKDSEAFIFSFLYKKKYMIKDSNQIAIGCHEIRGPSFGYVCRDI